MNLEIVGGRKFFIAVLTILCTTGLMWDKKIADGIYSTVMIATIGAYIAGNVTQKAQVPTPDPAVPIVPVIPPPEVPPYPPEMQQPSNQLQQQ